MVGPTSLRPALRDYARHAGFEPYTKDRDNPSHLENPAEIQRIKDSVKKLFSLGQPETSSGQAETLKKYKIRTKLISEILEGISGLGDEELEVVLERLKSVQEQRRAM